MSDPRPPEGGDAWPQHDLDHQARDEPSAPDPRERDPWNTERPEPEDAEERDPWGARERAPRQRFSWRGRQSEPSPDEPVAPQREPDPWGGSQSRPEPGEPRAPESGEPRAPEPDRGPGEPDDAPGSHQAPVTEAAPPTTAFSGAEDAWDRRLDGERRRPTTAEQAVPWLIGLVLALAGMVVVLLALIFTGPDALLGSAASPTPTVQPSVAPTPEPSVSSGPAATPTPAPTPVVTPTPAPTYGPLEMVYLGRQTPTAPIYLLRHDFTTDISKTPPEVMAKTGTGVTTYAWAPDGTRGAAVLSDHLFALNPGGTARDLGTGFDAMTFSLDSETIFTVRVVASGSNDEADVMSVDFASGAVTRLTSVSYPHPVTGKESALKEAQYLDDGGAVRLYATIDGNLALWILGAPATYRIDPADGSVLNVSSAPMLWSPAGKFQIVLTENSNGSTVIAQQDGLGNVVAKVTVTGLVSHIRWAPSRNEIVFTLGRSTSGGGVRQDLYVWDLVDGKAPSALTSDGAAFGAEWLGVAQSWHP